MHVPLPGGPGGGGWGGGVVAARRTLMPPGGGGVGEGDGGLCALEHEPASRGPQSSQSSQELHAAYSEPSPPSSQSPSPAKAHVLRHSAAAGRPGGGGDGLMDGGWIVSKLQPERGPQSSQSVHTSHAPNSAPSPPSSQSPSPAKAHVLTHVPLPGGPGGGGDGDGGGGLLRKFHGGGGDGDGGGAHVWRPRLRRRWWMDREEAERVREDRATAGSGVVGRAREEAPCPPGRPSAVAATATAEAG